MGLRCERSDDLLFGACQGIQNKSLLLALQAKSPFAGDRSEALSRIMVGPFRGVPYSFGALRKVFGPLWVRSDGCRRYSRLSCELRDVDSERRPSAARSAAQTARWRSRNLAKTPGWKTTASTSASTRHITRQR